MTKRTTKTKEEEMELRRKRGYQSVTRNNKKSTKLEAAQNHLISKLLDDATVPLDVLSLQVIQQAATLTD